MIRTQVQLTDEQLTRLRLSATSGKSVAELIRNGVDQYLTARPASNAADRIERAIRLAGKFSSGRTDVSAEHDRHLADAFRR